MKAVILLSLLAGAIAAPESRLIGPTIPTCVIQIKLQWCCFMIFKYKVSFISLQPAGSCAASALTRCTSLATWSRWGLLSSMSVQGYHLFQCIMLRLSHSFQDYIRDTYCPTLGDHQNFCRESLSRYYVGMLVIFWPIFQTVLTLPMSLVCYTCSSYLQYAVVEHYFVDGALHVCQTGGVCEAAKE